MQNDDSRRASSRLEDIPIFPLLLISENPEPVKFDIWQLASTQCQIDKFTDEKGCFPESLGRQMAPLFASYCEAKDQGPAGILQILQLEAAKQCIRLKERIQASDGAAVMEAAAQCAAHGLAMPRWLASQFVTRVNAVAIGDARTWDDEGAFGPAHPKGRNIKGVIAEKQIAPQIYDAAIKLLAANPSAGLDNSFFEEVGEKFNMGCTRVQELINIHVNSSQGTFPGLAELKPYLRDGMSLVEAFLAISDLKSWEIYRNAGYTVEYWEKEHGRSLPSRASR